MLRHLFQIFFAFGMFAIPLHLVAQSDGRDPGTFYGFWEMDEPAGDTCVINIKRGNRISAFFSGSGSTAITKGRWERRDGKLFVTWESGFVDVLSPFGAGALQREAFTPGQDLNSTPHFASRAIRIDSRIPGSLGVQRDPASSAAEAPAPRPATGVATTPGGDIPLRNDFNGFWRIEQGSGGFMGIGTSGADQFYLHLQRNGTARVSLRRWDPGNAVSGTWTLEGDTALIAWPSGHHDVLNLSDNGFSLHAYNRGRSLDRSPDRVLTMHRATPTEASGFFNDADLRFFTMSDVRGVWIPATAKDPTAQYLFVEGWGHARRHPVPEGTQGQGEWKMFRDRLVITWADGSKSVLRVDGRGWVEETFPPGVPASGTPAATQYIRRVADNVQGLASIEPSAR